MKESRDEPTAKPRSSELVVSPALVKPRAAIGEHAEESSRRKGVAASAKVGSGRGF